MERWWWSQIGLTLSSNGFWFSIGPDGVRVEAVAQQCALGEIGIGVTG